MFQDLKSALNLFVAGIWAGKEALCIDCVQEGRDTVG